MEFTFVYSPGFVREWNHQRLTDDDLRALESALARAPDSHSDSRHRRAAKDAILATVMAHGQERRLARWVRLFPREIDHPRVGHVFEE
jgi:hypothetical protein